MSATASIVTTERVQREDGLVVRCDTTTAEYEDYFWAKEALDETLYMYLATLSGQNYKLEATQYSYTFQTADARNASWTRSLEKQIVINE